MANRLAQEQSLYLRQHADNPVDWYPWGEAAFARAQAENLPVLISIGYSACHWCHVMAHESFEDNYIAGLMNAHFVCIKVDREERPDVDAIYMEAVQMMNGHGGWPLNVFCLPDGRPFAGGTYFPPDERRGYNMVPWPQLLMRVAEFFKRQRKDLEENAAAVIGNLRASNQPQRLTGDALAPKDVLSAAERILESHDGEYGGFGSAPKFPPAQTLDFLLALRGTAAVDAQRPELAAQLDGAINRTLTGMAHGGLYDQIGGGFARYSVDRFWLIPHFEKMLYDNALLLGIYARAYQRYPKPVYAAVVAETIGWLNREMVLDGGGYAAALDADTAAQEGLTYLWTPTEVAAVLEQAEAARFCEVYGIDASGNFEHTGKSNPALLDGDPAVRAAMAGCRERLLAARNQRPQPQRDDKFLTAWNALLVGALSQCAFTFGRPDWLDQARACGERIWRLMRRDGDRLYSVAYGDKPSLNGNLDDYAYCAQAFLELAAVVDWIYPGEHALWLDRAIALTQVIRHHFADSHAVGFFFTSDDHEALVHRKKDWYDTATPAGNSALIHIFAALELLTGSPEYADEADRLSTAYPGILQVAPAAASHALSGWVQQKTGIAIVNCDPCADREALRAAIVPLPWRRTFVRGQTQNFNIGDLNILRLTPSYQLCIGTQCFAPEHDAAVVAAQIAG